VFVDSNDFNALLSECFNLDNVKVAELKNRLPRTLLRGISTNSLEWHVYFDENFRFWCIVYPQGCNSIRCATFIRMLGTNPTADSLFSIIDEPELPPKDSLDLLYPDCCDYEFCRLLRSKGVPMSFDQYMKPRNGYSAYLGVIASEEWYLSATKSNDASN
jgi:hypothetical protein